MTSGIKSGADAQKSLPAILVQKDTLVVGSEQDYPPFATGMTDASAGGFTVDLWKAVAAESGLNFTIRVRPFHQILQEFKEGKIDVLINLAQSDERHKFADFAVPHVVVHGAIFVRKGDSNIRSENDLAGKSIIVLNADLAHDYAVSKGWEKQLVLVDTSAEGLRLLASGKHDAMLLSKLTGMQTLQTLGLTNVEALKAKAGFSQKFAFAVQEGQSELLGKINEGLALTKSNGIYNALYDKWFGIYEVKEVGLRDLLKYIIPIILVFLGIGVYFFYRRQVEREEAEAKLRTLNAAIEQSPASVVITDLEACIQYVNPRFTEVTGYGAAEAVGQNPSILKSGQTTEELYHEMWGKLSHGMAWHGELLNKRKNGELYWEDAQIAPVKNLTGTVTHYVAVKTDITERKQAEQALAESESRFREIFNTVSDAIFIHDADTGHIIDVNRSMCEMYGLTREEALACGPDDLSAGTPPYSSAEAIEKIRMARAVGPQTFDWFARAHDGHLFWTEVSLRFALIGSHHRILAVVRDITDRKHLEEELRQINETLEQRVQEGITHNMAQERLLIQQSRLAAMGEMIGNIAHQWRQPINALTLLLSNIKDAYEYHELDKAYLDKEVRIGQELIQKMSRTIDDFRNFFRPNKEKQRFCVCDSVEEAIKLVTHSFKSHNIEITQDKTVLDKSIETCRALGYPNEFAQVVLNVLSNAKEAITNKNIAGEVHIKGAIGENTMTLSIRDNGGGIPEEILGKVFDPYFTTKEKGTGIGLYMSKMIMEHMDGGMSIRNVEGGAEVLLTLPLAPNPAAS